MKPRIFFNGKRWAVKIDYRREYPTQISTTRAVAKARDFIERLNLLRGGRSEL